MMEYFDLEKQYLKYYEFYLYLIIIHHIVHMNILVLHKKSNGLILKWDDNSNILQLDGYLSNILLEP